MTNKNCTTENFIKKAKEIHGKLYDYSLVEYKRYNLKVKIICSIHGVFEQKPQHHLRGSGCPICVGKNITKDKFIDMCLNVHNNKYDYSLVNYVNLTDKVKIICPIHGIFEQMANLHLKGSNCAKCCNLSKSENKRLTTDKFIERSRLIHNNIYDYKLVQYVNAHTKLKIICKKHGIFEQIPSSHLSGKGCSRCAYDNKMNNTDIFIKKAKKIHGDKYDYSKVIYEKSNKKVIIICSIHGEFLQKPNNHLQGNTCNKCAEKNRRKSNTKPTKKFIQQSKKIHGDKYDYSLVEYKKAKEYCSIICKTHGIFQQTPDSHLRGAGCPNCYRSLGEDAIKYYLIKYNILFEEQKTFKTCKNKKKLHFDFYLKQYNLLIEYNGKQHYEEIDFFHKKNSLQEQKNRDNIKRTFAQKNNIKLVEIAYWNYDNIESILKKELNI